MFIPLSIPNLGENEKQYASDAISSQWVSSSGKYLSLFEENLSTYLNTKNVLACQSGTCAIHLSLILSKVSYDDEVIVPTVSFIATVNPIKYLGADPIFMDCDDTLNMDLDKLELFLENKCTLTARGLINKVTNKVIKALVVVHVFGNLIDMKRVMRLGEKYNIKVIEDSAQALGTYYIDERKNKYYGGCSGDFGIISFNANKIITTGGGGLLITKSKEDYNKAVYLSTQAKDDALRYIHNEVGYNYKMSNIQGALGVAQLKCLEEFIKTKTRNYRLYKDLIKDIEGLEILNFNEKNRNNYWFYSLIVNPSKYNLDKEEIMSKLASKDIQTRPLWGLIHKQIPYKDNISYKIEKAYEFENKLINLPCSTNLREEEIAYIVSILESRG